MGLKIFKRKGVENYYLRGAVAGIRVYESTNTSDRELAEAIRIQTEGRLSHQAAFGKKAVASFDEAVESYMKTGAPMRFIVDVRKTDGHVSGLGVYFRGRKLKDIKQADLDKAAKALLPKASRETLVRQVYTPFIAVWNHAVRKEMADVRMWERPRKAKGTNVQVIREGALRAGTKPVDYETAARFIGAMSPAPGMLTAFLFYTGLRPIEAFALEAHDIHIKDRWIVVRSSKTGEPRGVPLHWWLVTWFDDLLSRAAADGERVFRTPRGAPYNIVQDGGGGLKSAINGARRRSGITISPYTARHTVSTQLVVVGTHPHIKDQILGHASDSMSRHYTNVPQAPLIDAIDKLPVPASLAALPWVSSPKTWWGKLVEGTGRRNDLLAAKEA